MPLWKLTPLNPRDGHWQASDHAAATVVRAPSESVARAVASLAFARPGAAAPGAPAASPWGRPELVSAMQLAPGKLGTGNHAARNLDTRWPEEGPIAVLDPPGIEVDLSDVSFHED